MHIPKTIEVREALKVLEKEYDRAFLDPYTLKPLSRALYRTWKHFNAIEKNRFEEDDDFDDKP